MESHITREAALELGYDDDEDFWGLVGLLHDIDFEMYPEMLGWPLDEVLQKTLDAMKAGEAAIAAEFAKL